VEAGDELALSREYPYYDPIYTLGPEGQDWWRRRHAPEPEPAANLPG
jgi:lysine 2,3-aminomutase